VATGPAPTRSGTEDLVLDLLLSAGLVHPQVNAPLWIAGRRLVADLRWPGRQLIVEVDSDRWHGGALAGEDCRAPGAARGRRRARGARALAPGRGSAAPDDRQARGRRRPDELGLAAHEPIRGPAGQDRRAVADQHACRLAALMRLVEAGMETRGQHDDRAEAARYA